MVNFTKTFITNKGAYTFRFSKVESKQVCKYFVSVEEGPNRIASFDIKQNKEGKWKVVKPAPSFIVQEEQLLALLSKSGTKCFLQPGPSYLRIKRWA